MEKWYSIEPIKGYVCKSDFIKIKEILKSTFDKEVTLIKKQKFILVIITGNNPTNAFYIHNLLNIGPYKKVYEIETLTDDCGRFTKALVKKSIGVPY